MDFAMNDCIDARLKLGELDILSGYMVLDRQVGWRTRKKRENND